MSFQWFNRLAALSILAFALASTSFAQSTSPASSDSTRSAVLAVLDQQQQAWNRGDIPAFMAGYWNSPHVSFASSSGFTHGWSTVLDHYKASYPDKAAMGHLTFDILEVRSLGDSAALVVGKWRLHTASGDPGGLFSLVFQKFPEGWRIIHDHTSSDAPKKPAQ